MTEMDNLYKLKCVTLYIGKNEDVEVTLFSIIVRTLDFFYYHIL
jgi:hypothetical protein